MKDNLIEKVFQPKTIKNKNNGCGIVPGNLVIIIIMVYFQHNKVRSIYNIHNRVPSSHISIKASSDNEDVVSRLLNYEEMVGIDKVFTSQRKRPTRN